MTHTSPHSWDHIWSIWCMLCYNWRSLYLAECKHSSFEQCKQLHVMSGSHQSFHTSLYVWHVCIECVCQIQDHNNLAKYHTALTQCKVWGNISEPQSSFSSDRPSHNLLFQSTIPSYLVFTRQSLLWNNNKSRLATPLSKLMLTHCSQYIYNTDCLLTSYAWWLRRWQMLINELKLSLITEASPMPSLAASRKMSARVSSRSDVWMVVQGWTMTNMSTPTGSQKLACIHSRAGGLHTSFWDHSATAYSRSGRLWFMHLEFIILYYAGKLPRSSGHTAPPPHSWWYLWSLRPGVLTICFSISSEYFTNINQHVLPSPT